MQSSPTQIETVAASYVDGMHFTGTLDTYTIELDAAAEAGGMGAGPQPVRLLLLAIAGCTAMDVLSILRKKRQRISGLQVSVSGARAAEHPRVYSAISITYTVTGTAVDAQAVARAIELSETRYCPAIAMLGATAPITSRFEIAEDVPA
jgi:putative redox protein